MAQMPVQAAWVPGLGSRARLLHGLPGRGPRLARRPPETRWSGQRRAAPARARWQRGASGQPWLRRAARRSRRGSRAESGASGVALQPATDAAPEGGASRARDAPAEFTDRTSESGAWSLPRRRHDDGITGGATRRMTVGIADAGLVEEQGLDFGHGD